MYVFRASSRFFVNSSNHNIKHQTAYLPGFFAFRKQHTHIEKCSKIEQAYYHSFATDINVGSKL
ncbi:MAG: hypothetical protein LBQ65_01185 [Tannerellaceae bacterium]|nr:hypothetical protein [Tannerellaceae bacterium]